MDEAAVPGVLVVGDEITTVARLGDGAGGLSTGSGSQSGYAEAATIEVADFDEDGWPDLLVNGQQDIRVLHSDGAGNLLPGAVVAPLVVLRNPLAVTDLDADGHADVVWAQLDDSLVSAVLGDGTGGFSSVVSSDLGAGETQGLQLGDVDEDGLPDVVVELFGSDTVVVAFGQGDGSFASPQQVLPSPHGRPMLDDLNGDGHLDVAAYDWQGGALVVEVGDGDGNFSAGPTFPMDFLSVFPTTGDLNGDGLADALLRADYSTVRLLLSNPCGCAE
ncbi:MAG: VCBS repeat-containing protein [Myxococcales bacterium]|nr:VCBS repeat-containing protein [Myxococcales bacterium]